MLATLLRVTLPGNAKAIMNWDRVNQGVSTRMNLTKERFLKGIVYYSGMHHIFRYLLLNIDYPFLLEVAKNPMSYYLSDLVPQATVIKKVFDTVSISTENYGMLMDRQNSPLIPEIWIYTSRKNPLFILPLNTIDWSKWKNIDVAKVFNYDTPYLNIDFLKGTLTFPSDIAPTYGLVGVDIPCVWLKWISWWLSIGRQQYGRIDPQPSDIDDFVHQEIMPRFYEDFKRIFIINTLKLAIQGEFDNWKEAVDCLRTDYRIAMSGFEAGCTDLYHCLGLVKSRGMAVEDFLSTPWLFDNQQTQHLGRYSLRSLMLDYTINWHIPDLRQYFWIIMLRDLDLTQITTSLLKQSPRYPIGERTKKELNYVINTYERAVPWEHVHNPSLRAKLQNAFLHMKNDLI